MNDQIVVRPAVLMDIEAVLDLWEREGGSTRHVPGEEEVARLLGHDPEALLVAVHDSTVIGTLIVGWDGWRCHMYRLVVDPKMRRQGLARTLVSAAEARGRRLGAKSLDASVDPDKPWVVAFWESIGFTRDHDRRWSCSTAPT